MMTQVTTNILRETEKAYNVELFYNHLEACSNKSWKAWLPKSQVSIISQNDTSTIINAPEWLLSKIDAEIAKFQGQPQINKIDFIITIQG